MSIFALILVAALVVAVAILAVFRSVGQWRLNKAAKEFETSQHNLSAVLNTLSETVGIAVAQQVDLATQEVQLVSQLETLVALYRNLPMGEPLTSHFICSRHVQHGTSLASSSVPFFSDALKHYNASILIYPEDLGVGVPSVARHHIVPPSDVRWLPYNEDDLSEGVYSPVTPQGGSMTDSHVRFTGRWSSRYR